MDWITMSCLIFYLRWGSKLGSNSKIGFCLLWAELWHAARVNYFLYLYTSFCRSKLFKNLKQRLVGGISTFRVYWDAVLGSLLLVQDSGSELMCFCVWAAEVPKPNSLLEPPQLWVTLLSWDLALCLAWAWSFSFEDLLLSEIQQHLSGQEFQLDTASAPVVWWGCPCPQHELCQ